LERKYNWKNNHSLIPNGMLCQKTAGLVLPDCIFSGNAIAVLDAIAACQLAIWDESNMYDHSAISLDFKTLLPTATQVQRIWMPIFWTICLVWLSKE